MKRIGFIIMSFVMVITMNIFFVGYSVNVYAQGIVESSNEPNNNQSNKGNAKFPSKKYGSGSIYTSLLPGNNAYNMKFGFIEDINELINITEEEELALNTGNDINLMLDARIYREAIDSSEEVDILKIAIDSSDIKGSKPVLINYININLIKEIQSTRNGIKNNVDRINMPVPIVIKNPAENIKLKDNFARNFYIFTVDDEVVSMEGPLKEVNGLVTFSIQKSGICAITYIDSYVESNVEDNAPAYVPQSTNTSPEEIKNKINSFVNRNTNTTYFIPSIIPEYTVDDSYGPSDDDDGLISALPKKEPISSSKLFIIILLVDFLLAGVFILIFIRKRNKIA